MQQQSVAPAPSFTPSPSPYPPNYYQPAANAMMQQQQTNPAYPYPMYPPMPMWQQPFQKEAVASANINSSNISTSPSPTNTVGCMEVVTILVQPAALQPKVIDLTLPFKTRWEAVQATAADKVGQK
eukprot:889450-Ditylum_brightwellii.AAC.1